MCVPRASAMPRLRAAHTPPLACRTSRTSPRPSPAQSAPTTEAPPSVEPSSTTTISHGGSVCPRAERTARATSRSLL